MKGLFTLRHLVQPDSGTHPASYPMGGWWEERPEREADHSYPSSAEVKNAWSYTFTLPYVCMAWCLVKHTAILPFTLIRCESVDCTVWVRNLVSHFEVGT
jgi:hypothetical protein